MSISRLLVALAAFISLSLMAPAQVDLSVSPAFGMAPLTANVKLTIEPHPDNRVACLSADGSTYTRSCWEHGPTSPRTIHKQLRNLPAGPYDILLDVSRSNGSHLIATGHLCSIGPDTPLEIC